MHSSRRGVSALRAAVPTPSGPGPCGAGCTRCGAAAFSTATPVSAASAAVRPAGTTEVVPSGCRRATTRLRAGVKAGGGGLSLSVASVVIVVNTVAPREGASEGAVRRPCASLLSSLGRFAVQLNNGDAKEPSCGHGPVVGSVVLVICVCVCVCACVRQSKVDKRAHPPRPLLPAIARGRRPHAFAGRCAVLNNRADVAMQRARYRIVSAPTTGATRERGHDTPHAYYAVKAITD